MATRSHHGIAHTVLMVLWNLLVHKPLGLVAGCLGLKILRPRICVKLGQHAMSEGQCILTEQTCSVFSV